MVGFHSKQFCGMKYMYCFLLAVGIMPITFYPRILWTFFFFAVLSLRPIEVNRNSRDNQSSTKILSKFNTKVWNCCVFPLFEIMWVEVVVDSSTKMSPSIKYSKNLSKQLKPMQFIWAAEEKMNPTSCRRFRRKEKREK